MAVSLLGALFLFAAFRCWPAMESTPDSKPTCSHRPNGEACRCDTLCAQYGDCCLDAPSFVSEDQQRGASPFVCDHTNVYMMSSCPPEWIDSSTRFHCEHPDTSYQDPLFDVPVTSHRTNITYRNRHCALCHYDLDSGSTDIWSPYFLCDNAWLHIQNESIINHLVYDRTTLSWVLNMTAHPELLILRYAESNTLLFNCKVGVWPSEMARTVLRTCDSSSVDTCPEYWTDEDVRVQCEAYTAHTCLHDTVYRNHYCGLCNNNGTFHGIDCFEFDVRVMDSRWPLDFTVLLNWHGLRERDTCQQDVEEYDPFTKTCRTLFMKTEYLAPENSISDSKNETSTYSFDTCLKIPLDTHEYYVEDNDTMTVFIPAYNMSLQPHEYKIDNHSRLIICVPKFKTNFVPEFSPGVGYITVIGISLSILFLVLHLAVFGMTPKLRNLSSMNLASLSVALLLMYVAFFVGSSVSNSGIPCIVMAVIIHYSLLASFCWMLTIAYDVNRVLRQTTTKLLLTTGKHWQKFGCYSLWSWTFPAAVVGAALTVDFSTSRMLDFLRPGYGARECYISNSTALLIFTVGPLLFIMVLNAVFFIWSACLIQTTRSEPRNTTRTRTDFSLYVRLALIMGLTWAVGLIAGYANSSVLWYAFVVLNTLQGLFIFLAFSCTKKVWYGLCAELGLQCDKQKQATKSALNTGTAVT